MSAQQCVKFTIVCRGQDAPAIDEALREAVRQICAGYFTGHNANDKGAYYFETETSVPQSEWPA
jgi:hypothetical protein